MRQQLQQQQTASYVWWPYPVCVVYKENISTTNKVTVIPSVLIQTKRTPLIFGIPQWNEFTSYGFWVCRLLFQLKWPIISLAYDCNLLGKFFPFPGFFRIAIFCSLLSSLIHSLSRRMFGKQLLPKYRRNLLNIYEISFFFHAHLHNQRDSLLKSNILLKKIVESSVYSFRIHITDNDDFYSYKIYGIDWRHQRRLSG